MKDSKLQALQVLISEWPGLAADAPETLIEDSLTLLQHLGNARRLVDVGSGGGMPGLPLKIVRPDLLVTLVEANQTKAAFLVQACARLELAGTEVVPRRAEEVGRDPRYRETFDVAVARALAPMRVLVELCLPLVAIGGRLLAQKTDKDKDEVDFALEAIHRLGGELDSISPARSPSRARGTVVNIAKVRPTPEDYPRRPGVPRRKPL